MYGIARERARDDAEDAMEAESRAIERRATAFLLDDVDLGDAWRDDDGDGDGDGDDDEENRGARALGRGRSILLLCHRSRPASSRSSPS